MQLHGCARHCRLLFSRASELSNLTSYVTLAPSQPHSGAG
jgi:hypothetical protein